MANRGVNEVTLVGYAGRDPEMRYMPEGGAIAALSLATAETWKDRKTGEQKASTEWHRVILFGKPAEIAEKFVRKGSLLYVRGRLRTRRWTDRDNTERWNTEVVVNAGGEMQMLAGGRQDASQHGEGDPAYSETPAPAGDAQDMPPSDDDALPPER